jgi:uncharacterized caspase-like protein
MNSNENRKALLIGVNKYENLPLKYNLNNCVEDAKKMALVLRKQENKVEDNFFTILCTNPTHKAIKD